MKKKWISKYDKLIIGVILGVLFPVLGFFISYLLNGGDSSFSDYCRNLNADYSNLDDDISRVYSDNKINALTICLIANMALFYLTFFIFKMNKLSKGIVGMTILLAALTFMFI